MEFCAHCYHPYSEYYNMSNGTASNKPVVEKTCACGCVSWKPIGAYIAEGLKMINQYLHKMSLPPQVVYSGHDSGYGAKTVSSSPPNHYYGPGGPKAESYESALNNLKDYAAMKKVLEKDAQTDEE